jgi:hypothetical protein
MVVSKLTIGCGGLQCTEAAIPILPFRISLARDVTARGRAFLKPSFRCRLNPVVPARTLPGTRLTRS